MLTGVLATHTFKERGVLMKIKEIMTHNARCIDPKLSLKDVAKKMVQHNISAIPVGSNSQVNGVITNGCVLRAIAEGKDINKMTAADVMNKKVFACHENDNIETVAHLMSEKKVR